MLISREFINGDGIHGIPGLDPQILDMNLEP